LRLFFVVEDLDRARAFYDPLFEQSGQLSEGRLAYVVDGVKLDFYRLTPQQAEEFQLQSGNSGICLESNPDLNEGWVRPWGPAPWGGSLAHLQDPFGFRWELIRQESSQ